MVDKAPQERDFRIKGGVRPCLADLLEQCEGEIGGIAEAVSMSCFPKYRIRKAKLR
jgi:hypothetical protein